MRRVDCQHRRTAYYVEQCLSTRGDELPQRFSIAAALDDQSRRMPSGRSVFGVIIKTRIPMVEVDEPSVISVMHPLVPDRTFQVIGRIPRNPDKVIGE